MCYAASPSRSLPQKSPGRAWDWEHSWSARTPKAWAGVSCLILLQALEPLSRWSYQSSHQDRKRMPQPSEDLPLALVVDDDEVFRNRLCRALSQREWEAETASDGEEALRFARDRSPDLVLLDLRMPGKSGLDVVPE